MQTNDVDRKTLDLNTALADIVAIRRSISAIERIKSSQMLESTVAINRKMHVWTLTLCILFLGMELGGSFFISESLINKNAELYYRILGTGLIGLVLTACAVLIYVLIWNAVKESGVSINAHIKENFSYLNNFATVFDLFIKFVVVAAMILIQKPELVSPFLFLFLADYLIQGRYFVLSFRIALPLALLFVCLAGLQIILKNHVVMWPLLAFGLVNGLSLLRLRKLKKVED